jgi:SAM-dependent methyltransferase
VTDHATPGDATTGDPTNGDAGGDLDEGLRADRDVDLWESHADWWIDGFTAGADPEYEEQILPLASTELAGFDRILDIGCGDGQISRLLARAGSTAVGIDPTWNQIRVAGERGGGAAYVRSGAAELPFADACFDAAVACLVFEHIDDLHGAIDEVARVLRPGGRFSFFLNHPLLQTPGSGWISDHTVDPPESYWRIGPYLVEQDSVEQVERGVFIRFLHRPLSTYLNALREAGLVLERMVEPAPPSGFLERAAEYEAASAIPRLLYLRLLRA